MTIPPVAEQLISLLMWGESIVESRTGSRWASARTIQHTQHIRATPAGAGRRPDPVVQVGGWSDHLPELQPYHASKSAIEDFVEATAKEVGPFGTAFMIVESGLTGTNFGASLRRPVTPRTLISSLISSHGPNDRHFERDRTAR